MDENIFKQNFGRLINTLEKGKKPHKVILLLAIIDGFETGTYKNNRIDYDQTFKDLFSKYFVQYSRDEDSNRPVAPFFHLKNTLASWKLYPQPGKENDLYKAITVGSEKDLHQIVEYGYFDEEFYSILKIKDNREEIKNKLINCLVEHSYVSKKYRVPQRKDGWTRKVKQKDWNKKYFPHEKRAIDKIVSSLKGFVEFIPNYFLFDPSTHQYFECDLVAVSVDRIAIIELKHWSGDIEIRPNKWKINNFNFRKDPHISNKYKCQVLKSLYESLFPTYPKLWIESIVVLTNHNATIDGESHYKTDKNNPTFVDIESLEKHYKYRCGNKELKRLSAAQVKAVVEKLKVQGGEKEPTGFILSGFDLVEDLTDSSDKIEVLVRPHGMQLQTIQRVRIFLDNPRADEEEVDQFRLKAYNNLRAIAAVGDHPNINKVWQLPHEDGLVIEASDWSQEGTLSDFIHEKGKIDLDLTVKIITGILNGLTALHKELVIHRAICPENILMVKGVPKLINFDLSYVHEDNRPFTVIPESMILKPSPYIAPELYPPKKDVFEASDFFGVGVIFFELITGKLPFKNSKELNTNNERLLKSAKERLQKENISETIQNLILSLIDGDIQKRPQAAGDILDKINKILDIKSLQESKPERTNRKLVPGEIHGAYEIEALIGAGRSAQVYRAKHVSSLKFAIKIFYYEISRDRVVNEYNALKRAICPYVVRCETLVDKWNDGRYFLALKLIEGESLKDNIENKDLPDIMAIRHLATCLFEALDKMHNPPSGDEPILHCDIKPENIILQNQKDPVLIDFGISTSPHIGTYMGTEGYVAPDLINGVDLEYHESGDLFSLGLTLFEWIFGVKPYKSVPSVDSIPVIPKTRDDIPKELINWLKKAVHTLRESRFNKILEMRNEFEACFLEDSPKSEEHDLEKLDAEKVIELKPIPKEGIEDHNGFVSYLNTLHNVTPNNPNSLAESQALNQYFGSIHVKLDLTKFIIEKLTADDGNHVILTGHAGDGKSTIGLELFKQLKGIPILKELDSPLNEREEIRLPNNKIISLVKDMSELSEEDRAKEIVSMYSDKLSKNRKLIISNTGTFLDTMQLVAAKRNINKYQMENDILSLLGKEDPGDLNINNIKFTVVNIARIDNTETAIKLFDKLLNNKHWGQCSKCRYKEFCPIALNVFSILESINIVRDRISYIYRRLSEYGQRLTMRQITGHLAYALTAGIDCKKISLLSTQAPAPDITDFLFYNRFFGFKGSLIDQDAVRLTAISYISSLEMGSKPFPPIEQQLWTNDEKNLFKLPRNMENIFNSIKTKIIIGDDGLSPLRLRQQIRRMLYVYCNLSENNQDFVLSFLDSKILTRFVKWQSEIFDINQLYFEDLKRKILHVLQEQFTGIQLPDSFDSHYLYIVLKRTNEELRQTVQILLTKIPLSNFRLKHRKVNQSFKPYRYTLSLYEKNSDEHLDLELPFLDFVMLRGVGEIGQRLDIGYIGRVERFKSKLLEATNYREQTDLELLEMTNGGELKTHKIHFKDNVLQVM